MAYEYKMVQVPPNIQVKRATGNDAADYLQTVTDEHTSKGWEFYRVDSIGIEIKPGCLGALLGQARPLKIYYVVTFRRSTP